MALLFRVRFEAESVAIDLVSEGQYLVTTQHESVLDLFDTDEHPTLVPQQATTFERALAKVRGWEQGTPVYVDPLVADSVTAALVVNDSRKSSGWQTWLTTGQVQG